MRDFFLKDFGWKSLSVCVALVIWLTVHKILTESPEVNPGTPESTTVYSNLTVVAVSSEMGVRSYRLDPPKVVVTLKGPVNLMAQLEENQIRTTVDLTGASTNKTSQAIVQVSPPRGVTVLSVEPYSLIVHPPEKQ